MNRLKKILSLPSTIGLGLKLASEGFAKENPKYIRKQKSKIALYILTNPIFSYDWFNDIKSETFYHIFLKRPRIYVKPFRPYISTKWTKKQKTKIIKETYKLLEQKNLTNKILNNNFPLATITSAEENQVVGQLEIAYDERFRKEGELVLVFTSDLCGGKVTAVSFSFSFDKNNDLICYVGCVQGHTDKAEFKKAQKLLYGMRPNAFIIYALQVFAKSLGVEKIIAANNTIQANRKKHFINIQSIHKINFDYDKFYQEVGGKPVSKDWSQIPIAPQRKEIEDIKSKKRNLYKKRYTLLDDITVQIQTNVELNNKA